MSDRLSLIKKHQSQLRKCNQCSDMLGKPVVGFPAMSGVLLMGQAPGIKELEIHRPFAWTAGKTLFKWFARIDITEEDFRKQIYMSAVCRCFPGKNPKGGDRVPNKFEIKNCSQWLNAEIALLQPQLIIPVGKLAISQLLTFKKLTEVVGQQHEILIDERKVDVIPLPHPSGVSTWPNMQPGKSLLAKSLRLIQNHAAWKSATQ